MTDQHSGPTQPRTSCELTQDHSPSESGPGAPGWQPRDLTGDRQSPAHALQWSHTHPRPRPYHQMLRTWNYAWWKPVAGVAVFLALFLAVQVVMAAVLVATAAARSGSFTANLEALSSFEDTTLTLLLVLNLSLGAMTLVAWATMRLVHRMRPRWLTSVAPKMR